MGRMFIQVECCDSECLRLPTRTLKAQMISDVVANQLPAAGLQRKNCVVARYY